MGTILWYIFAILTDRQIWYAFNTTVSVLIKKIDPYKDEKEGHGAKKDQPFLFHDGFLISKGISQFNHSILCNQLDVMFG